MYLHTMYWVFSKKKTAATTASEQKPSLSNITPNYRGNFREVHAIFLLGTFCIYSYVSIGRIRNYHRRLGTLHVLFPLRHCGTPIYHCILKKIKKVFWNWKEEMFQNFKNKPSRMATNSWNGTFNLTTFPLIGTEFNIVLVR